MPKKSIVVMNTLGQNANAVAELVFGLLIYVIRNFYNGKTGTELKGKKLVLLAFGQIPLRSTVPFIPSCVTREK